ncbi:MAG: hypothetical protein V4555_17830 [Acidobacteriota bacterium]
MQTDSGLKRCICESGKRFTDTDQAREEGRFEAPKLSNEAAVVIVEMLSSIPFFPKEGGARLLIAEEIRGMCHDSQQGLWLAQRMARLYSQWPGVREMRAVYCSKHRPLDGVELIGGTEAYPDGIPPEKQISEAPMKALPPGRSVSAAESLENTVIDLATAKSMRVVGTCKVRDIPMLPPGQRVTQADIDAAVAESRQKIAREQLGGDAA